MMSKLPIDPSWQADLHIERICDKFERSLRNQETVCIEQQIDQVEPRHRRTLLRQLLQLEIHYRCEQGDEPSRFEYCLRFLNHTKLVDEVFAEFDLSGDSERGCDFLFGLLAVQLKFIDPLQLSKICQLWSTQNHQSLRQLLIEQVRLTEGQVRAVDTLLEQQLQRARERVPSAVSQAFHEAIHELVEAPGDETFPVTLSRLFPCQDYVLQEHLVSPAPRSERYTLTRLHKQGGAGQVWLARDRHLNRDVAFKEIRPDRQTHAEAVRRFIREAQITGQLEHPNIVPVHDLETEAEHPFYTMRFIRGHTLRLAIRDFHARANDAADANVGLRKLLAVFLTICRAVDYAHSRGIVHRDLKPSNVVLGDFGEVVLLDWGLAKLVGEEDDDDELTSVSVKGLAAGDLTLEGDAVGTPGYMAPEQAKGRQRKVDRRSDVYSLGATLFEILTSEVPHRGTDSRRIIEQVIAGPPPRAKSIAPHVPPPLDAICAKAMEKQRADRYQSAAELADDIDRWLADESVSVYQDPISVRFARWTRRHRTWAQSVGAALVIIAAVASVAAMTVHSAWQVEQTAKQDAVSAWQAEVLARREAVRRLGESLQTIDTMLTGVSSVLRYYPGVQPLRQRLLEAAAHSYERLAQEPSADPSLKAQQGRALLRLGEVHQLLAHHEQAVDSFQKARQVFAALAAEELENLDANLESAMCDYRLGQMFRDASDYETAMESFAAVLSSTQDQENPAYRHLMARTLIDLALLHEKMNHLEAALTTIDKAKSQLVELNSSRTAINSQFLARQGLAQSVSGHLRTLAGDNQAARDELRDAIKTHEVLRDIDEEDPQHLEDLAYARIHLGQTLGSLGLIQQQRETLIAAVADLQLLLGALPGVPIYREQLAISLVNLADVCHQLGDNRQAWNYLNSALGQLEPFVDSAEALPRYFEQWAIAHAFAARVLDELGDPRAQTSVDTPIDLFKELLAIDELNADYHRGQAFSEMIAARLAWGDQHDETTRAHLQRALQAFARAIELNPNDYYARDGQATCFEYVGDVESARGEPIAALESYQSALASRDGLPRFPTFNYKRAALLCKLAADAELNDAMTLAAQVSRSAPENAQFTVLLGAIQCRRGDYDSSVTTLSPLADRQGAADPSPLFWLAKARWLRNEEGDREIARALQERAVQRMEQNAPQRIELRSLQQDVSKLMDISPIID